MMYELADSHSSASLPLAFFIVAIVLPLWFAFVLFVVSRVSGWNRWATHFLAGTSRPTGATFTWRSARVGSFGNYNNCLRVTVTPEGFYLVPMFMIGWFHRPMLLPWSVVEKVVDYHFFFSHYLLVCFFADGRSIKLALPKNALEAVRAAAPANISMPTSL